jgi:hypothetical protein
MHNPLDQPDAFEETVPGLAAVSTTTAPPSPAIRASAVGKVASK